MAFDARGDMPVLRKLWSTQQEEPGADLRRHESRAQAYRYVENDCRNYLANRRVRFTNVFVDERDGFGPQLHERVDLEEWADRPG